MLTQQAQRTRLGYLVLIGVFLGFVPAPATEKIALTPAPGGPSTASRNPGPARPAASRPDPAVERAGWEMGKIEPAVSGALASRDAVPVLIFLAPPARGASESVQAIRRRHAAGIRAVGRQIQDLHRRYRPEGPLTEEVERAFAEMLDSQISPQDREQRRMLQEELDRRRSAARHEVRQAVERAVRPGQERMTAWLAGLGITVTGSVNVVNAVAATLPAALLTEVAEHPDVRLITLDREPVLELDVSLPSAGHSLWHTLSMFASSSDAGLIDTGVQEDHPAFAGITFISDQPAGDSDGHGTHVAGIVASTDPDSDGDGIRYDGGAKGIQKMYWSALRNEALTMGNFEVLMGLDADTPDGVTMSAGWGDVTDTDYSANDSFYDAYSEFYDVLITKGAGNSGPGPQSLNHPGNAYNLLIIGNMNDQGTTTRTDDSQNFSTGEGPTLGNRRKPDIVAPGTSIRSTSNLWSTGNDFVNMTGSSMATPHGAAGVLLLQDVGVTNPLAQKAVIINAADWWSSNGTPGLPGDDFQVTTGGGNVTKWDPIYGYGYLDMVEALANDSDYFEDVLVPNDDDADEDDYKLYAGVLLADEKATLTWWKRSDYVAGGPATTTYALSNLDLTLFDELDGSIVRDDADANDNVAQVSTGARIDSVIKVHAVSTSFDGASEEEFVLATEENFAEVAFPDTFKAWRDEESTIMNPGEQGNLRVSVENLGQIASHGNSVQLVPAAGWALISGSPTQSVGSIAAGVESPGANWTIQAPDDSTPPSPSTMFFDAITPVSTSELAVTATLATDEHGPVQYYIDYLVSPTGGPGGTDSGWVTPRVHANSGLGTNHEYCYRVRARDAGVFTDILTATHAHSSYEEDYAQNWNVPITVNDTPNSNAFSASECAYTRVEVPDPVNFTSVSATTLTVSPVTGVSGLGRGLTGTRVYNGTAGTDSGWLTTVSPWQSTGLTPNTPYTFRSQARNGDGVETSLSAPAVARTLAAAPALSSLNLVGNTSIQVQWDSNGNPAGTEYLIENTTRGTSSGWVSVLDWTETQLRCGTSYSYRGKARNADGVEISFVSFGSTVAGDFDFDGDLLLDCEDPDDDNDGVDDGVDCAQFDPGAFAVPGELTGLAFVDPSTLSWDSPQVQYGSTTTTSLMRGYASEFPVGSGANEVCGFEGITGSSWILPANPEPGQVLYFLGRPENACGNGSFGTNSTGGLRAHTGCD